MAVSVVDLDAHEQPSEEMKAEWKAFSRLDHSVLLNDTRLDDPRLPLDQNGFCKTGVIPQSQMAAAFAALHPGCESEAQDDVPILYHPLLPGLLVMPSLVPPAVQTLLLDKMLHRDLSNPTHQTNIHLHYDLPYPQGSTVDERSFFSHSPESTAPFTPKDPTVHNTLSVRQVMQRRLHWVTLGGQYDWTNRVYPEEQPPQFPPDISQFLMTLFPETQAQAAIVNFYSPGDTMMMHRDVSEETDKGLVSLSFGCEGLFMIAPSGGGAGDDAEKDEVPPSMDDSATADGGKKKYLLLRLRSGDAIYMTQASRYAWHGVPKVLKGTCPSYLENWPAKDGKFEEWQGWMQNKRINLNVRQMRD